MPASVSDASRALVFETVSAGYGGEVVLRDVTLALAPGVVHALIGPNGAGKSTVARVACGLRPLAGRVTVAGKAPRQAKIGLSPQECALFPALTPRENVEVLARLSGVPAPGRKAAVAAALERAACEARADQPVRTLSGGWRRRANLAAALVGAPDLVIADEPTEGVDVATRAVLGAALRAAAADGAICFLISHDADFVGAVADHVSVLIDGQVVRQGSPEELIVGAFGETRLVTVRLPGLAEDALRGRLESADLSARADDSVWTGLIEDGGAALLSLSEAVANAGGELSVRRPGLDHLVDRLREAAT